MGFSEYASYDATGLARLVRSREVHPLEILEASIATIEHLNPVVNAVVFAAFEEARRAAPAAMDGPFAGVPMLIKDLGLGVAGWPRTSGSRLGSAVRDGADSGLVRRYRDSGAVLLGRSATSEFGMIGTTETAAYGPTRNPWNPDHSSGGSSGGSAAAVACGMVPIAHASDGLGSIRIPAACCGVVGLKPTRDRVPNLPDGSDYAIGFVCDHIVSRSVRDCAAMLDVTGIPEAGSPFALPTKEGRFADDVDRVPGRLRVHWSSVTRLGGPIDPEIEVALEQAATVLTGLGHDVRPHDLGIDEVGMTQARLPISAADFAASMTAMSREVGREPSNKDVEPLVPLALEFAKLVTGEMVVAGMRALRVLARDVVKQFDEFDVFLSPVMTRPPPLLGTIDALSQNAARADAAQFALYPYAFPFNFTGQPSMSLPLAMSSSGLPIGMMFTARYGDEATLFRLAGQLEREMPWRDRRPALWG